MRERFRCLKLSDGVLLGSKDWVVEEVPLSIFINGRHFTTAMISPEMSEEFIIGNLFSERIIGSVQEIESLQIEENTAKIVVKSPLKALKSKKNNRERMRW
ncbi:Protein FdhD [Candidatus Methanoperedenaceae archaeon GB37]|nr:Protein FdhD [Candidatus Methanoperedenaceae archaeon GB37]